MASEETCPVREKNGEENSSVAPCGGPIYRKQGVCRKHYDMDFRVVEQCKERSCEEPVHAKGYCQKHYTQDYRHGELRTTRRGGKFVQVNTRVSEHCRDVLEALGSSVYEKAAEVLEEYAKKHRPKSAA